MKKLEVFQIRTWTKNGGFVRMYVNFSRFREFSINIALPYYPGMYSVSFSVKKHPAMSTFASVFCRRVRRPCVPCPEDISSSMVTPPLEKVGATT